MMRARLAGLGIFLLILMQVNCSSPRSQADPARSYFGCYYEVQMELLRNPSVYVDFLQFRGEDATRLDLYFEVPYTHLHFTRRDDERYVSEFTLSISVHSTENAYTDRKEVTRSITETREGMTRYGAGDRGMQSFFLEPGSYEVIVTMLDQAVGARRQLREEVEVRSFRRGATGMSDILLIRSIRRVDGRRIINPMLPERVVTLTEPFHVFTELYADTAGEAEVRYGLVRKQYNNDFIIDTPFSYRVQRQFHRAGIRVDRRDTVFVRDTTIAVRPGATQAILTFGEEVPPGSYEVFVKKSGGGRAGNSETLARRVDFMVHTMDFPHMTDVDQQIDALEYIASTRELEHMRGGETVVERRKRLNEYWQNAGAWKMSDYYERIRLANELFTTNIEGWKSPMGMVFIVLGEPNLVDCRVSIERTEVWTYYLQGGAMEFVFIRERGADRFDPRAYYWMSSIRGGYSAWIAAVNAWR
jgi:GWxTD domain-containing protein